MDWSSIYDENGDESGNFPREDDMSVSMRTGVLDSLKVYNPYVCYAFTVNYILGVGCLGIPYAFYRSGIVLGSLLIIFLSFISYTTVMWIAETSHRGMQQRLDSCSKNPFRSPKLIRRRKPRRKSVVSSGTIPDAMKFPSLNPFRGSGIASFSILNVKKELSVVKPESELDKSLYSTVSQLTREISRGTTVYVSNGNAIITGAEQVRVGGEIPNLGRARSKSDELDTEYTECSELEVTELTLDLLGSKGFVLFQASLSVLTYVGLLAYTQVFIQSFKSEIWPGAPSVIPNLIFGLLVVPLSCCDLAEQITAQVLMSCLRFFSLGILVAGALTAFYFNGPQDKSYSSSSILINRRGVPLVEFSGFGIMFTTAIFSQIFPHIVPGVIRPLALEDKKHIPRIFFMALLTTSTVYISIGCACVLYFGENVKESVNLNFIGFATQLVDPGSVFEPVLSVLSMVVVLFPALDTVSIYPLIANTLGNNLNVAFPFLRSFVKSAYVSKYGEEHTVLVHLPHTDQNQFEKNYGSQNENKNDSEDVRKSIEESKKKRNEGVKKITSILWRMVAAIPPVICSHFVTDLSVTLQVAGLCGIILALIIPALLQKYSRRRIASIPLSLSLLNNPYTSVFSASGYTDVVLGIATVAFAVSIMQMI